MPRKALIAEHTIKQAYITHHTWNSYLPQYEEGASTDEIFEEAPFNNQK